MKRRHSINMFPICNLNGIDFSFKLIEFDWEILKNREEVYHQSVNKLTLKISSQTKGPCALYYKDGKPYFAIPKNKSISAKKISVGPLQISINPLPDVYDVSIDTISTENLSVIHQFIEFSIRENLNRKGDLWRFSANQYFWNKPVNKDDGGNIDVFGGFQFRLVRKNKAFYIVLDVNYKYIGRQFLSEFVNKDNILTVGKSLKGARCLYMNGDDWYTVVVDGFANSISEQTFGGKTIYNYILDKNNGESFDLKPYLKKDSVTLLYKYPGRSMQPHTAAACLAKQIFPTDHPDIREMHRRSALVPFKRFKEIKSAISRHFQNITINDVRLEIVTEPIEKDATFFEMPALKFNNGKVLSLNKNESSEEFSIHDFASERKRLILENGILNEGVYDPQFLVVPRELEKGKAKLIKELLEDQIRSLSPAFKGFKIVTYKSLSNKSATHQIGEIQRVFKENNVNTGSVLFILPNYGRNGGYKVKNLHDLLKNKFYPDIKFQCASQYKVESYIGSFPDNEQGVKYDVYQRSRMQFKSYLFNLALEHLLANRKWPYALSKNAHYDIYIGVDVHDRYVGLTFFYKNGEKIYFDSKKVPMKTGFKRAEKIRSKDLVEKIYEKLKAHIPLYCNNPNGIVLIRDGRSFGEEEKALLEVIEKLNQDHLIEKDKIRWSVVDLHKQSAIPLRIASHTSGHDKIENPRSGAYVMLNENEGFIFSTGFPFKIPGSVKPLNLIQSAGNCDFKLVLEDIYNQCILAFSAPDRSNSLPITIKLIDCLIQPLAYSSEEVLEEDEMEFENEENTLT